MLGLCPLHHLTGGQGIAYHAGPRTWERNFGSQEDLLATTVALVRNKRIMENPFGSGG